jgi:large subunit ribosomal protein L29|tara:strand:- start:1030 stop:1242 length:213 start_codon:yes stop_codon:yes gene_type:complete
MAVIRTNEIRTLSEKELNAKLVEMEKEITGQNAKLAAGGMADNPGKLAEMKKVVARIKTIAKEKKFKINE